jgi:hypothetical protein
VGIRQLRVFVSYEAKEMKLVLDSVFGDAGNIFFYSIPFSRGEFKLNFEFDFDKNGEEHTKGWHEECKISAQRLKKTTAENANRPQP